MRKIDEYILYLNSHLMAMFADKIIVSKNEFNLVVKPSAIVFTLRFFKMSSILNFQTLMDVVCVDYPVRKNRFELIYVLTSIRYNIRIKIKCFLEDPYFCTSVTSVFCSAVWLEREVYDLFGIFFFEHPDLRRILTDYGFEGYPLRKDFPLSGFIEIRYNESAKRIVFEPIEFVQKFRYFDFKNPWN